MVVAVDVPSCIQLLRSCGAAAGRQLHQLLLKSGHVPSSLPPTNSVLLMYVRGSPLHTRDAARLFDEMTTKNCFSYNSLITALFKSGDHRAAVRVFRSMPDRNTFSWNAFGCGYDQQGILLNRLENTDGILGLSNHALSLPTQLARRGIVSNVFGHCMTRDPSGGGYLFLGDEYLPRLGMTWVPIRDGPADDIRRAQVQQVNHWDQQLNVQGKFTQVIFDSGSKYTYFRNEALMKLISSLKAASPRFVQDHSDKTLPFCMKVDFPVRSVEDVKHFFKPLNLQFKNLQHSS